MFSIPKPLQVKDLGLGLGRHSDTATTPYPLHLSITAPQESRLGGDWGLKRPLPKAKLSKTSTPIVRVNHIDAIEAVTDYGSAAGHSQLVEKFQEMNIHVTVRATPLPSTGPSGDEMDGLISVFEEDFDVTDLPVEKSPRLNSVRWKFSGPWLAKLTEKEFRDYVTKEVRSRKAEFREFLCKRLALALSREATSKAIDQGIEPPPPRDAGTITNAELVPYMRYLRGARRIHLYNLISQFLDLPPAQPHQNSGIMRHTISKYRSARTPSAFDDDNSVQAPVKSPYGVEGPPITHPSAGISYLRTSSFMENHPLYGPQDGHSPVLSRIISPSRRSEGPKLGVGGFVVSYPETFHTGRRFKQYWRDLEAENENYGLSVFDPTLRGGASAYLVPQTAKVRHDGKVEIKVETPSGVQELIKREEAAAGHIYLQKPQSEKDTDGESEEAAVPSGFETRTRDLRRFREVLGSSRSYGLI